MFSIRPKSTFGWSSLQTVYAVNPLGRIRPMLRLGYASTSPWGRFGGVANQCPEIQTRFCSHSYLNNENDSLV